VEVAILVVGLVLVVSLIGRLHKERCEVRNRGVNESSFISLRRASGYVLARLMAYGAAIYLLAAIYFFIAFRATCQSAPESHHAYDHASLIDHLGTALAWPLFQDADLPCEE
jgi:hypothetical protein